MLTDSFKKFYNLYFKKYNKFLLIAIFGMILTGLSNGGISYLSKPAIDKVFIEKNSSALYLISFLFFLTFAIKAIGMYIQSNYLYKIQENLNVDLKKALFAKYIKLPFEELKSAEQGKITNLISSEINEITRSFSEVMLNLVRDLLTAIVLLFVILFQELTMSLVFMIITPVIFLLTSSALKYIKKNYLKSRIALDDLNSHFYDVVKNFRVIKAYCGEFFEENKFFQHLHNSFLSSIKMLQRSVLIPSIIEIMAGFIIGFIIFYGGTMVIIEKSTAGSFFSFIVAIAMIYKPLRNLSNLTIKIQTFLSSIERLMNLLNLQEEDRFSGFNYDFSQFQSLSFKDISYSYDHINYALDKISFEFKRGEKIAFVGESGSGKSTIINLLLRFFDPYNGKIQINNQINYQSICKASIRKNIAYLSQENLLFNDTIINNLFYPNINKSKNKNLNNIKEKFLLNFIDNLEHKFETKIDEKTQFSGGQSQRIAIARAALKNADIIILDECTSALDNLSQEGIKNLIYKELKDKTIIIIAHRLTLIEDCDKIYIMKNGKILDFGTNDELIKSSDYYRVLKNIN